MRGEYGLENLAKRLRLECHGFLIIPKMSSEKIRVSGQPKSIYCLFKVAIGAAIKRNIHTTDGDQKFRVPSNKQAAWLPGFALKCTASEI